MENPTRTFLSILGKARAEARARARARARIRARPPLARAGPELPGAARGRRLPHGAAGMRLDLRGVEVNGMIRVGFGAHKIWGS